MKRVTEKNWRKFVPICLIGGPIDDAKTLAEARHLAIIQLDLIAEQQDGTEEYGPRAIQSIRRFAGVR